MVPCVLAYLLLSGWLIFSLLTTSYFSVLFMLINPLNFFFLSLKAIKKLKTSSETKNFYWKW